LSLAPFDSALIPSGLVLIGFAFYALSAVNLRALL
jgi:hypothetical protein